MVGVADGICVRVDTTQGLVVGKKMGKGVAKTGDYDYIEGDLFICLPSA